MKNLIFVILLSFNFIFSQNNIKLKDDLIKKDIKNNQQVIQDVEIDFLYKKIKSQELDSIIKTNKVISYTNIGYRDLDTIFVSYNSYVAKNNSQDLEFIYNKKEEMLIKIIVREE